MSERINITPLESGTFKKAITENGFTFNVKWYARENEKREIQNYEASTSSTFDEYDVPKYFNSLKRIHPTNCIFRVMDEGGSLLVKNHDNSIQDQNTDHVFPGGSVEDFHNDTKTVLCRA